MDTTTTIEKVSENELKIVTVTPEKVIPEETKEEVCTIETLQARKASVDAEVTRLQTAKDADMKRYEDVLAPQLAQQAVLQGYIDDAVAAGVKCKPEPVVEVIKEIPVEKVVTP